MRNPSVPTRFSRMSLTSACVALAIIGSVALGPLVSAQESTPAASSAASPEPSPVASPAAATAASPAPQASPAAQAPAVVTGLMTSEFTDFPAAPMTVRLLRITLAPGASVPMHTHPGPEFDRVESGVLTAEATGDAQTFVGGSKAATTLASTSADLQVNDWILYPAGVGMSLTNNGDTDAILLSAVILPVGTDAPASIEYTDGAPSADAFNGVSFAVLGDGLLPELPTGTTAVTIDRVDVPDGTDLPGSQGPALYSQVTGNLSFKVDGGNVQVSRSASPGLQPNAIPNQQFSLDAGDAAFFPSGVAATSRSNKEGAYSFFRLSIQPASSLTASPATITAIASSLPATAASGTPVTTASTPVSGFSEGALVRTNTDGVNMRAEASINADIVNELNADIELTIVGGPEEADNLTWYQVQLQGEVQGDWSAGWVARDFLQAESSAATPTPAPPASSTMTPAASGTPSASGTPAVPSFAIDAVVVTTEDNVRVRSEATTDGEAINAIPKDTQLIITGEPVKADNYTWYPVAGVDTDEYTGWVVANFIELAPQAPSN